MSDYQPVSVQEAASISEKYSKDVVVIFAWDREHGCFHTTTFGITPDDKTNAAAAGEIATAAIGGDLMRATHYEDFRNVKPAEYKAALDRLVRLANEAKQFVPHGLQHNIKEAIDAAGKLICGRTTADH